MTIGNDDEYLVLAEHVNGVNGDVYRDIESTCVLSSSSTRRPNVTDVPTFNYCENWYNFTSLNERGCMRCSHGYYGLIRNWKIDNCKEYDDINEVC